MEADAEDRIFSQLATGDWANHEPITMGRRQAPPPNMVAEGIELIRYASTNQPMIIIFAFSPTTYASMANIPGVYIYGLNNQEKDMAILQIQEVAEIENFGAAKTVAMFIGASPGEIQSIIDRIQEERTICISMESTHSSNVNTAGGLGLHVSKNLPAVLIKRISHIIVSGDGAISDKGKKKSYNAYITTFLDAGNRSGNREGRERNGPGGTTIIANIPKARLNQGVVTIQATAAHYESALNLQKILVTSHQCQEEKQGLRTLLGAMSIGQTTHHRFQDEGDGTRKNIISHTIKQSLQSNKMSAGKEEGIYSVYLDAPYSNFIHAYSDAELDGKIDVVQDVCNGAGIAWRIIDSHNIQMIASPVEWQCTVAALKEKGICFASGVTKATKRIKVQRYGDSAGIEGANLRIKIENPGAETEFAVQWEPPEGDPGLLKETAIKDIFRNYGIKVDGWDMKWKRIRLPKGTLAYRWTWEINFESQGDDENELLLDMIENGTSLGNKEATGNLVFMGIPVGNETWQIHHRKLFPEPQERQLMPDAIRFDPRLMPQTELVTLRHPVVLPLIPRSKMPGHIRIETAVASDVAIAPPVLTNATQEDLLIGKHAYLPLGVRIPSFTDAPREDDMYVYSIHPVSLSDQELRFQGTFLNRKMAAKGVRKIEGKNINGNRLEKMVSTLVEKSTACAVAWEVYVTSSNKVTTGTILDALIQDEDIGKDITNADFITAILPIGGFIIADEIAFQAEFTTKKKNPGLYSDLAIKVQSAGAMMLFAPTRTLAQRKVGLRIENPSCEPGQFTIIMCGYIVNKPPSDSSKKKHVFSTSDQSHGDRTSRGFGHHAQTGKPPNTANDTGSGSNTGGIVESQPIQKEDTQEIEERAMRLKTKIAEEAKIRKLRMSIDAQYHQRQKAAKCGYHVLNNLLQSETFDEGSMQAAWESRKRIADARGISLLRKNHITPSGDYSLELMSEALSEPGYRKSGNKNVYHIKWVGVQSPNESIIKWSMGVEEGFIGVIVNLNTGKPNAHYIGVSWDPELGLIWRDSFELRPRSIDSQQFHLLTKGCILLLLMAGNEPHSAPPSKKTAPIEAGAGNIGMNSAPMELDHANQEAVPAQNEPTLTNNVGTPKDRHAMEINPVAIGPPTVHVPPGPMSKQEEKGSGDRKARGITPRDKSTPKPEQAGPSKVTPQSSHRERGTGSGNRTCAQDIQTPLSIDQMKIDGVQNGTPSVTGNATQVIDQYYRAIGPNGTLPATPETWKLPDNPNTQQASIHIERQLIMHEMALKARQATHGSGPVIHNNSTEQVRCTITPTAPLTPSGNGQPRLDAIGNDGVPIGVHGLSMVNGDVSPVPTIRYEGASRFKNYRAKDMKWRGLRENKKKKKKSGQNRKIIQKKEPRQTVRTIKSILKTHPQVNKVKLNQQAKGMRQDVQHLKESRPLPRRLFHEETKEAMTVDRGEQQSHGGAASASVGDHTHQTAIPNGVFNPVPAASVPVPDSDIEDGQHTPEDCHLEGEYGSPTKMRTGGNKFRGLNSPLRDIYDKVRRVHTRSVTRSKTAENKEQGHEKKKDSPSKRMSKDIAGRIGDFMTRAKHGRPLLEKAGSSSAQDSNAAVIKKWTSGLHKERRPYALISGCDGTHAARIALQEEVGRPDVVVIMESDVAKRAIVCEKFGYPIEIGKWHLTKDGVIVMILSDVWQVLQGHAKVLKEVISLLKIAQEYTNIIPAAVAMWGTSCQDLTAYAEGHCGAAGYAGKRSVLMHAAHLTQWVMQMISDEVILLPMMENAGSTRKEHLEYLNKIWKNSDGTPMQHYIRAGECSESARNRYYHTGFPKDSPMIDRPPVPWDAGWRHNLEGTGKYPPWMRTREYEVSTTGDPLYSTLFYHPKHLLLKEEFYDRFISQIKLCPKRYIMKEDRLFINWKEPSVQHLTSKWAEFLPERLRDSWQLLVKWPCEGTNKMTKAEEVSLVPLKTWIEGDEGQTCPFRTPRPHERLKDCGLQNYFQGSSRLASMATKTVIGNMTGDIFKPYIWQMVWRSPTGATLKGIMYRHPGKAGTPPVTIACDPATTIQHYTKLHEAILAAHPDFEKYLANGPYFMSNLDITLDRRTWTPLVTHEECQLEIVGSVVQQAHDWPAVALVEPSRAAIGGGGQAHTVRCIPNIHVPEEVNARLYHLINANNHKIAWMHGADHGHAIRNVVTATCTGGLSVSSECSGDEDSVLIPEPLEECRRIEQRIARNTGHEIFLGLSKLGTASKIGMAAAAGAKEFPSRWGCIVVTGRMNTETQRWEAESITPAMPWKQDTIVVIEFPQGIAVLGSRERDGDHAETSEWVIDLPFYDIHEAGTHQVKYGTLGIKVQEVANKWIIARGGLWMPGVQSNKFASCVLCAWLSSIGTETWTMRKGSVQNDMITDLIHQGPEIQGKSGTAVAEYIQWWITNWELQITHWVKGHSNRAHDALELSANLQYTKETLILTVDAPSEIGLIRHGRPTTDIGMENQWPCCLLIHGETVRHAKWLPNELTEPTVQDQRAALIAQDLRSARVLTASEAAMEMSCNQEGDPGEGPPVPFGPIPFVNEGWMDVQREEGRSQGRQETRTI